MCKPGHWQYEGQIHNPPDTVPSENCIASLHISCVHMIELTSFDIYS